MASFTGKYSCATSGCSICVQTLCSSCHTGPPLQGGSSGGLLSSLQLRMTSPPGSIQYSAVPVNGIPFLLFCSNISHFCVICPFSMFPVLNILDFTYFINAHFINTCTSFLELSRSSHLLIFEEVLMLCSTRASLGGSFLTF
jgi:hypothetical protein